LSVFITRLEASGPGPRVAVKDAIDVVGVPTTAGSRVVAERARPAGADAACLAGFRAAGARIVGKANLHELCFGRTGVNPWFGTPTNPYDPACVPGGSSSGSGVAVAPAVDEADIALGTDTAGSIRNPAAWCGVVGLKTTFGRIPVTGTWPLAPSLDTIGPMGATVARVVEGMTMLESGFLAAGAPPRRIGRVRGIDAEPWIDRAVDAALRDAGFEVEDVVLPGWAAAHDAGTRVLFGEAIRSNVALVEHDIDRLGPELQGRLATAAEIDDAQLQAARAHRDPWRAELAEAFERFELLALPTAERAPFRLDEAATTPNPMSVAVNLAGHPALALPLPGPGRFPASLQLIGPDGREDLLVAAGAVVEAAGTD
jgi:amidase